MPRANRYFIPGHLWHITHRCHRSEFLLKFARDRKRWRHWLFEAKKTVWFECSELHRNLKPYPLIGKGYWERSYP